MKAKKLLALLLALVLVVSAFAACGEAAPTSSTGGSSTAESSTASSEASQDPVEDTTVHPCRIVQPGTLPVDYETGIGNVNAMLAADGVNIEVEIIRIPWDAYAEKLNLMLTIGEEFEVLHIMQDVKNISGIAGMGAVISIQELIKEYPDLYAKFGETEWQSTVYNGEYYAVPDYWTSFDKTMSYMTYRSDVAKAVGYDEFPTDLDGIIDLMKKSQDYIKEESGMVAYSWMHQNQDTAHWLHRSYDSYPFYVENALGIVKINQDGTIESFYESEEFKKDANTYYELYQAGLIDPDVLNRDSQKKYDDQKFGAMLPSQTFDPDGGVTMQENGVEGAEVLWVRTFDTKKPDMIYTFGQNMNAISATAEDPHSGLKFFNWLYASEENHAAFHYGIEGTHYTKDGDHKITQILGDDGNALYQMDYWMTGYIPYKYFASHCTDNYMDYETYKSDNYVVSPAAAFIFDASNVQSEQTNLETEIKASIYPIKFGLVSYEENIDDAIAKLKAAGLDTYMNEWNTQFQKYLSEHPEALEMAKGTTQG